MAWRNQPLEQAMRLGLAFLFFGLASSNTLMSLGLMVVVGASLGQYGQWPLGWWKQPAVWGPWLWWLALLWPVWHGGAIDLIFRDLQMKIALLLFPLAWPGLSLGKGRMAWAMAWAAAGSLCAVAWGAGLYFRDWPTADPRTFSPFVSNVRLSTLLVLIASWFVLQKKGLWALAYAVFALLALLFMQSITGLMGAGLVGVFLALSGGRPLVWMGLLGFLAAGMGAYLSYEWRFLEPNQERSLGPSFSPDHHPYKYDLKNEAIENGHYVWDFVSPGDLHKCWPERSAMPLDGLHAKGGALYHGLIRYMTSRGMRKDAFHLRKLSDAEIYAIEHGTANWLELQRPAIRARVNAFFRDFRHFLITGDPNGKSFALRLVLWQSTWKLAVEKPWFGHGMGHLRPRLSEQLERLQPGLEARYRLNPHQQWLSLWALGGMLSVLLFLMGWARVLVWNWNGHNRWFFAYWCLMSFAFLGEDVLDTQAGLYQLTACWVLGLLPQTKEVHHAK